MWLIRCRLDQGNIALIDYTNDPNKFQILDRTFVLEDNSNDKSNKQIENVKSNGEEKKKKKKKRSK